MGVLAHFMRESLTHMLGFTNEVDITPIERKLTALAKAVEELAERKR